MGFPLIFFVVTRRCLKAKIGFGILKSICFFRRDRLKGYNLSSKVGLSLSTHFASGSLQTEGETWR